MVAQTQVRSERLRQAVQKQARLSAPTGGLNYINSTMDFPLGDAYILDNLIPKPYGCELRKGYQNWIPTANNFANPVKTIIPFAAETSANSRVFAAPAETPSRLYNITTQAAAPVLSLTPSTNSATAGEWYTSNFVTIGGNFLLAVSQGAGYYIFSCPAGVDTWTEVINGAGAGQIQWPTGSALTTKDISFVFIWKNRVWFLVKNSSTAYFLPVSQTSGQLSAFDFGQQFNLGGSLLWATNWTYDAGDGVDDSLILASSEGQVLVYTGTDPASAQNFSLKGRWFAGRFPPSRRNFCEHGGDVLFLSEYGIVSISDLVSGKLHTANLSGSVGYKINPNLAPLVTQYLSTAYWSLVPYPSEELLFMGTPIIDTNGNAQYLGMNSLTNAWCTLSAWDVLCAAVWQGKFIFGSSTGAVNLGFSGTQDGLSANGLTPGVQITGKLQGAFADYGVPNSNKRFLRVKLYGLTSADPSFFAIFRSEYDTSTPISAPVPGVVSGVLWDSALWDVAFWQYSPNGSFHKWFGVTGFGKKVSMQLAISGSGRVVFTDHEILYEEGIGL